MNSLMASSLSKKSANKAVVVGDDEDEYHLNITSSSNSKCEIEELDDDHDDDGFKDVLFGMNNKRGYLPMPSIKEVHRAIEEDMDCVYVGVGKSESSMDALIWTLNHYALNSSTSTTVVYLIHVFPEIKYIPTPLGKLAKSQVSPEQVESYMAQESRKRRDLLKHFLHKCRAVNENLIVDTILIESNAIGPAILDLIPILSITNLVLGTTKSSLRKLMARKGRGIADHILLSAPESCEISIISQGNRLINTEQQQATDDSSSISPPPATAIATATAANTNDDTNTITTKSSLISMQQQQQQRINEASFSFMCFKPPKFT